jgi:threonine dehydratase
MKLIYERMKLVVEPSGAAGLAAALCDPVQGVQPTKSAVGKGLQAQEGGRGAVRR